MNHFSLSMLDWGRCMPIDNFVNAKLKNPCYSLIKRIYIALHNGWTISSGLFCFDRRIFLFFLLGSKTQKTVTGKTSLTSKPDPTKTDKPTTQKTEKPTTPTIPTTSTQAQKVNPFMEMCKASPTAVLPHPQSCAKQVDCSLVMAGMVGVMECPFPTLWSTDTKRCDNPFTVKCGTRWEPKDACKDNI